MEMDKMQEFKIGDPISIAKSKLGSKQLKQPHQQSAVTALNNYFELHRNIMNRKGILVMPTGSGKTYTTVYWLMKEAIAKGYIVVWVVHRQELVDQTYKEFVEQTALLKGTDKFNFNIIPISGRTGHFPMAAAHGKDVYVLSRASAGNNNGLRYFKNLLQGHNKVVMVIDEAHHAVSEQYQEIWSEVTNNCKNAILLGLTATPTRVNKNEKEKLLKFFNVDKNLKKNKGIEGFIYKIDLIDLIKSGYLAKAIRIPVKTEIHAEKEFNITKKDVVAYGDDADISQAAHARIAASAKRNKLIVKQYVDHLEYGKTIVFAINIEHAERLCKDFRKALAAKNIRVEYVVSGKEGNQELIQEFKSNTDPKFKILINVQMLTEGSDIPDVQTVFLTRHTSSEALLMQMIGRGLRGPATKNGTQTCNVVAFHDIWDTFDFWMSPETLDIFNYDENELAADDEEETKVEIVSREFVEKVKENIDGDAEIPIKESEDLSEWEKLYLKYYNEISTDGYTSIAKSLPVGWYKLNIPSVKMTNSKQTEDKTMLVYDNQLKSFELVKENIKDIINQLNKVHVGYGNSDLFNSQYFAENLLPTKDVVNLLKHLSIHQKMPQYYSFDDVSKFDPFKVASMLIEKFKTKSQRLEWLKTVYEENTILEEIYNSYSAFEKTILDAMRGNVSSEIISDKIPLKKYIIEDNYYNLDDCLREVLEMYPGLNADGLIRIQWSPKIPRTWYALCQKSKDNKRFQITVNKKLSSPFINREVIKYLIFHELLHKNGYWNHDKDFRMREWQYPRSSEWDSVLDGELNYAYDFSEYQHLVQKRCVIPFPERNSESVLDKESTKTPYLNIKPTDYTKATNYITCKFCGSQLPQGAKFCMECGHRIITK